MRKILITAATFTPLEVEAVKLRPELRIAASADDLVIADMIRSAIEAYEQYTGNILCLSTWDLYLDAFPDEIETPGPVVDPISSIKYLDTAAAEQPLPSACYKLTTNFNPIYGLISLKYGQSWPATYGEKDAIYIRFMAGYENAAAIPQRIKDGLLKKIQELYYGIDMSAGYEADWINYRRLPI